MKKFNFSLMAVLFALFSTMTLTACSSDDDDDIPSEEEIKTNIIGTWQSIHQSGYGYDDEDEDVIKVDKDLTESESARIVFKSDGTYKQYYYDEHSGTWKPEGGSSKEYYNISGNKLTISAYYGNSDPEQTVYSILSLKKNKLIVQYTLEEGDKYKGTLTCKRVE